MTYVHRVGSPLKLLKDVHKHALWKLDIRLHSPGRCLGQFALDALTNRCEHFLSVSSCIDRNDVMDQHFLHAIRSPDLFAIGRTIASPGTSSIDILIHRIG